eukprot:Rmarinus@m.18823
MSNSNLLNQQEDDVPVHLEYISRRKRRSLQQGIPLEADIVETFIRNTFRRKECVVFTKGTNEVCVGCGSPIDDHPGINGRSASATWNSADSTLRLPTNSYGKINFLSDRMKSAQYVRVSEETDPKDVVQLMYEYWRLPRPQLVISVTGGAQDFDLKPSLRHAFMRGLMRTATSTKAWIISGGSDAGVMQYIGQAQATFQSDVPILGIITWGVIMNRSTLECSSLYQPVTYVKTEQNSATATALEENHTHFVMVDDGSRGQFGREIALRAQLERELSIGGNTKVPTVLLVVQGGPGTIMTVHKAAEAGIPVIVVDCSGKAADLLAFAWRHVHDRERGVRGCRKKSNQSGCCMFEEDALNCPVIVQRVRETYGRDDAEFNEKQAFLILSSVRIKNRVTIYDIEDPNADLDSCMLRAILQGSGISVSEQLQLAIAWNRVDIARAEILSAANLRLTGSGQIDDALTDGLKSAFRLDRAEFFKLLLEQEASFLSVESEIEDFFATTVKFVSRDHYVHSLLRPPGLTLPLKPSEIIRRLLGEGYECPFGIEPAFDCMLWATVLNRYQMAFTIWKSWVRHPIRSALVAAAICRSLTSSSLVDRKFSGSLKHAAEKFEKLAEGVLSFAYSADMYTSFTILEDPWPVWTSGTVPNGLSCLDIAVWGNSHKFVTSSCCQMALSRRWLSGLSRSNYWENDVYYVVLICVICPLLIPFIKAEPLDGTDSREEKDCVYEVKANGNTQHPGESHYDPIDSKSMSSPSVDAADSVKHADIRALRRQTPVPAGRLPLLDKVFVFYNAPVVKFIMNTVMYVIYIMLFSYTSLTIFPEEIRPQEYVLMFWVGAMALEEAVQAVELSFTEWYKSLWNRFDFAIILVYSVSVILRVVGASDSSRKVVSVVVVLVFGRFLATFTIHHTLGPIIYVMRKMMEDFALFMVLVIVVSLGFGVAFEGLRDPRDQLILGDAFGQTFKEAFFRFHDELGAADSETLRDTAIADILFGIYLVLVSILFMNVINAMVRNQYVINLPHSHTLALLDNYSATQEFVTRPPIPAPFVVFFRLYLLLSTGSMMYRSNLRNSEMSLMDGDVISQFMADMRDQYLEVKDAQERTSVRGLAEQAVGKLTNVQEQLIQDGLRSFERLISFEHRLKRFEAETYSRLSALANK